MKTRIFGKKDLILIGVLLLLATVLFCLFSLFAREGTYAVIRKDDRVVTILPLSADAVYTVGGNTVTVWNGCVFMSDADCPGGDCMRHAPIAKRGETIVCLPNRVTVSITADAAKMPGEDGEPDAIAG